MEEEKTQIAENQKPTDYQELDNMELDAFRQSWEALNAALAEIRELRGGTESVKDPVFYVKKEVENLKNQFGEIKEMISALRQQAQQQQSGPQQQTYQRYQPAQQTVPILPYYSTPNFAPMIPINQ